MRNYETLVADDGDVTLWNVYSQQWVTIPADLVPDDILATLTKDERDAIARAAAKIEESEENVPYR